MLRKKAIVRALSLAYGLSALTAGLAPAASAQDKIEVVQVTGTRITTPGTTSNSPISSISAEEIKSSQPIAVEEFFKTQPAATPATGAGTNNGTGGGATISLRGLGTNRTLVLVNGRRFVPFNLNAVVDTNSIPLALISRVDTLTGGASVAYGADAVSGVVNFNLKRNFTGVDLSTSYGESTHHDTRRKRTDLTLGANLDEGRGNVVLSLGKTTSDPLTQGARPFGVTSLSSVTGLPSGSTTGVPAIISVPKGTNGSSALAGNWQINPATGALVQPVSLYNTNPQNYYQTGLDRNQASSMGNYRINDHAEVYADIFYTASKVASTLAPSGTFSNVYNMPIGNPYLPDAARQQICARQGIAAANCVAGNATLVPITIGRRFTELGPRYNNFDNKTLQYTVGVRGEIVPDWNYDAYWSSGTADQTQVRQNWGSLSKVTQALNALNTSSCINPANGCVPLNVFGPEGSITPAMLAFINENAILMQHVRQDVASLSASGELARLRSPFAAEPVSLALGVEQRKMTAGTESDAASQINGEVLGAGAPTPDSSGTFTMKEIFVESQLPLLKNKPFARDLGLSLGYRETQFSTSSSKRSYGSYKYGGDWAPVESLRFRAMVQKATRAPNIDELFSPQVTSLGNLSKDPCQLGNINSAQANTAGTLSNLCRLTGVPSGVIGALPAPTSGQINTQSGGNPALGPEDAKTKTLGFVWEPVAKLAVTLDYYKIDITKAVSNPSSTDILDGCYDPAFNPGLTLNAACAQVQRSPVTGTFNGVDSAGVQLPYSNLGNQRTSGFDLSLAYRFGLQDVGLDKKYGALDLGFYYNQVQTFTIQASPTSVNRDCLGYYSVACGGPKYKRKFNQRTNWNVGDASIGYNWRYIGAADVEPSSTAFLPAFSHISAYNYLDLNAAWRVTKNLRLNVSVNNAFNRLPPIVGGTIGTTSTDSGNTFPQYYDVIGRYITVGASLKF